MKKVAYIFLLSGLIGCSGSQSSGNGKANLIELADKNFGVIPKSVLKKNAPKVVLGESLFFEKRLSFDNSISCNSCHDIRNFGVDNLELSNGVNNSLTKRNSPTILNTHLQSSQFWDGRASTLEEQIRMPMLTDVEMAMPSEEFILDKVNQIEEYKKSFNAVYPNQGITMNTMSDAVATYIRSLTTPSRFDLFLGGEDVLSAKEVRGMKLFIEVGCAECHNGELFGDGFEEFGVFDDYWKYTKSQKIDSGRVVITKNEDDLFVFKVPSLRNVTKTYPYFHDGSVRDLEDAIQIMAKVQLDQSLPADKVSDIAEFLSSLTSIQ